MFTDEHSAIHVMQLPKSGTMETCCQLFNNSKDIMLKPCHSTPRESADRFAWNWTITSPNVLDVAFLSNARLYDNQIGGSYMYDLHNTAKDKKAGS
ncbi:hypothetical protein PUN28_017746 [Cardiocondyla obscurior]|uniref:Ricin B lectin domain-containing protein n=1 Tax=Cardiocondyla obscurior TaxID=286306 RepID=A0AAW2EIY7_9HYME